MTFLSEILRQIMVFAYADDIAICVYFIGELHKAISIINKRSNEPGTPINFRKSMVGWET